MTQQNIKKLYESVIEEVIDSMREAVLDEGLDEQVLIELKQLWEQKLQASKVTEAAPMPSHMPVPSANPVRKGVPQAAVVSAAPVPPQGLQQMVAPNAFRPHIQQAQPLDMSNAATTATMALPALYQPQIIAGGIQLQPTSSGGLAAVIPASALQAGSIALQPGQLPSVLQAQSVQLQPQNLSTKSGSVQGQVDGAVDDDSSEMPAGAAGVSSVQGAGCRPKVRRKPQEIEVVIQLDGADSSSDEDDDVDDDDEDDNEPEVENNEVEEEPLNTDDDVSDDDQQDQFETDNVVVCQYDKITRSKNRWRFNLKDGIMNVNQRDYVFQRATGEAEW